MSKLKIRVISAAVGIVIVLAMIFSTSAIFHLMMAAACFIMLHELRTTFGQGKRWQLITLSTIAAAALLVKPILPENWQGGWMPLVLVVYLLLLLICSVFWNDEIKFRDVCHSLFMVVYAVILPMYVSYIRMMNAGTLLVLMTFLGAWMPDTFAYFVGCNLGKHKLIPKVSPNKTVEGSIGAVLGGVITFGIYGLVLDFGFACTISYPAILTLGLLCGVVAQLGDLSASVIKREYGIKDFGNLMPGHGGLVDRVDSLLFIAPLTYYFLQIFEVISK